MKVAHFRVYCNASNDSSSRWHIAIKKISKSNKCISIVRSCKENLLENKGFRVFLLFLSNSNKSMLDLSYTAWCHYIAPIALDIVHPQLLLCNAKNCYTANNVYMIAGIWGNSRALAKLGFKSKAKTYHPFFWKKNLGKFLWMMQFICILLFSLKMFVKNH